MHENMFIFCYFTQSVRTVTASSDTEAEITRFILYHSVPLDF